MKTRDDKKSAAQRQVDRGVRPDQPSKVAVELAQVDSKELTPPTEPPEPTEANVDVSKEEKDLADLLAKVKAKRATISAHKKQKCGGAKLEQKRTWALTAMAWVTKPRKFSVGDDKLEHTEQRGGTASQFLKAMERANAAVASLVDYEEKIQLPAGQQQGPTHAEAMAKYTEAAEILSAAYNLDIKVEASLKKAKS